jgi:hypothetical protein
MADSTVSWISGISAAVLASLGVAGLVVANARVRRATVRVTGQVFRGPGGAILRVTYLVRSTGLGKLKIPHDDRRPHVRLSEVRATADGSEEYNVAIDAAEPLSEEDVIYSQEDAVETNYILLPIPTADTIGWRLAFAFRVNRRWPRTGNWWWSATDFVPNTLLSRGSAFSEEPKRLE